MENKTSTTHENGNDANGSRLGEEALTKSLIEVQIFKIIKYVK